MSIILTVAAIAFVAFLPSRRSTTETTKTNIAELEKVEEAMRSFTVANGRRPCPADGSSAIGSASFGAEVGTPGNCTGAPLGPDAGTGNIIGGTIPTKALGLPDSYAFDAWGRRFTYVVDKRATKNSSCITLQDYPANDGTGGINIVNTAGGTTIDKTMYAYISHGASGYGAFPQQGSTVAARINSGSTDADMQHNAGVDSSFTYNTTNFTNSFVQKDPVPSNFSSGGSDTGFDDFVWYRPDLKNTCCIGAKCSAPSIWVVDQNNHQVQGFDSNGNYVKTIGSSSYISQPSGIAVDSNGNIWVAAPDFGTVQEFDSSGNYKGQLALTGYADGQLSNPHGVAIDSSNNIWVADYGNNRVEEFNSSGNWVKTIPSGCSNGGVPECNPGSGTSPVVQFNELKDIAVDSSGNPWVVDRSNNRVVELDPSTGNVIKTIPPEAGCTGSYPSPACSAGSGNGQLAYPDGIGIDSSNNVWVADTNNERVQEFNSSGNWVKTVGSSGYADGEFVNPGDVAVDSSGNIWVTDSSNDRVQEFNSSGNWIKTIPGSGCSSSPSIPPACPQGSGNGQFWNPQNIAIVPTGGSGSCTETTNQGGGTLTNGATATEYTTNSVTSPTTCTQHTMTCTSGSLSCSTGNMADCQYSSCTQVPPGCDTTGLTSFSPPSMSNDQSLPAYVTNSDASCTQHTLTCKNGTLTCDGSSTLTNCEYSSCNQTCSLTTSQGSGTLPGTSPGNTKTEYTTSSDATCTAHTMTCTGTSSSNTLSCSTGSMTDCAYASCLKTCSPNSNQGGGTMNSGDTRTEYPSSTGSCTLETMTCTDGTLSCSIGNMTTDCQYQSCTPSSGSGIPNNLWVVDDGNHRVEEFDSSGNFVAGIGAGYNGVSGTIGSSGFGNGQFETPWDIVIDGSGNLWVSDYVQSRIQEFDSSGNYLGQLGSIGFGNGQFDAPSNIFIDGTNNFWVADTQNNRIEEFDTSGNWIKTIPSGCPNSAYPACPAGVGTSPVQFDYPMGAVIDGSGNIWVVDSNNNRVLELNSSGNWIRTIPSSGCTGSSPPACPGSAINGQFNNPQGIAIDSSGNIWVDDLYNSRVQKFNSSGNYQGEIGSYGFTDGKFQYSEDFSIDSSDNILVADSANNRVQEFDSTGNWKFTFPTSGCPDTSPASCTAGSGNGQLSHPLGLAVVPPVSVSIASTIQTISGCSGDSSFGYGVAIGDINGDGYPDLAIGDSNYRTYVIYGSNRGIPAINPCTGLNGTNGFELDGSSTYPTSAHITIADINGDGYADIIKGAPNATIGGNANAGAVYVIFGGPTGKKADGTSWAGSQTIDSTDLNGTNGFELDGTAANIYTGIGIAAGDVNGDGIDDLVFVAPDTKISNPSFVGSVYVVFGKASGWSGTPTALDSTFLNGTNGVEYDGSAIGYGLGEASDYGVATADVNGDGYDDILTEDFTSSTTYSIYVILGHPAGSWPTTPQSVSTTCKGHGCTPIIDGSVNGYEFDNTYSAPGFDTSVTGGDVNGDGIGDIIIGDVNNNAAYVVFGKASGWSSAVTTLNSTFLNGTNGVELAGSSDSGYRNAGWTVYTANINGDKNGTHPIDDIFVNDDGPSVAGTYVGSFEVMFGKTAGWSSPTTLNSAFLNGTNGIEFDGPTSGNSLSNADLASGDLNKDGYDDVVFAAAGSGKIYIIYGQASGWTTPQSMP